MKVKIQGRKRRVTVEAFDTVPPGQKVGLIPSCLRHEEGRQALNYRGPVRKAKSWVARMVASAGRG